MNAKQNSDVPDLPAVRKFWRELRRRKVVRVAAVYLITGWLIIQVAETTFANFGIPDWAFRFVTLMVLLGLPVALILAWALELTPEGIRTTRPLDETDNAVGEPAAFTRKRNWTAYAFGALAPTVIFGGLAIFFYIQARDGEPDADTAHEYVDAQPARVSQSIAILPLVNMSSHEENAYFAGGIHEDVLTNLSRINGLEVISRTSMLRYAATDMTLREIGSELDVDYIVEGSVRRIGNHVRVTIQLINAQNDLHLWANNYERELVDVFATQSELAREISDSLHLELQPESVGKLQGMPTTSVRAYDLYIRAESLEKTEGETEESMMRRREMLEEAVAEDPNFVEAWAVLKRIYARQRSLVKGRGWYLDEGGDVDAVIEDIATREQRAMDRAIALDPDNVETLLSRVVDHEWPKTRAEMQAQKAIFDRILEKNPEHAKTWYHLAWWHDHLDELPDHDLESLRADAAAAFEEALRLDPFNARMVYAILDWYRRNGYEEPLERLSERLKQILPETAAERKFARVSWGFREDQIVSAFLETADESLLEEYEKGWQEAVSIGDFVHPFVRHMDESRLRMFSNDQARVIELASTPTNVEQGGWQPAFFSIINAPALGAFLDRGDLTQARVVARRILAKEEELLGENAYECPCIQSMLAIAHATLGNKEEARRLAEGLLDEWDATETWSLLPIIRLDTERAVGIAFGELARNPKWPGLDEIAAYYMGTRQFLAHPKVQEHYVREGKWTNYLAARVPEYAKYSATVTD